MHYSHASLVLLALFLGGCEPPKEKGPELKSTIAEAVLPAVIEVREAVQKAVPIRATVAEVVPYQDPAIQHAVRLIIRWEVTSPAYYDKKLTGVICPGGASGPTWGLGWDGGHQTQQTNLTAWSQHPEKERLAKSSGVMGARCKPSLGDFSGILTSYRLAEIVFISHGLPRYAAMAETKYGKGIYLLSPGARGALWSETYNRGGIKLGPRSAEQVAIRDICIPKQDHSCIAGELRKMCRLWRGTPLEKGLCSRREDEALTAEAI